MKVVIDGKSLNEQKDYSLDEQLIGTWYDGKPLYRRIVTKTITTVAPYICTGASIYMPSELIFVKKINGLMVDKAGVTYPIPYTDHNVEGTASTASIAKNFYFYQQANGLITISYVTNSAKIYDITLIIEYTKDSDTVAGEQ